MPAVLLCVNAALGGWIALLVWGAAHTGLGHASPGVCAVMAGAFIAVLLVVAGTTIADIVIHHYRRSTDG